MTNTDNERQSQAWFALADAKHGRLLRCSLTDRGTPHVDEYDSLTNTLPQQEHARPMTQGGATHNVEDNERRFACRIVEWLQENVRKHAIDHLAIFAAARMLGVLRKATPRLLAGYLEELKGDLMRLDAGQLAEHPMVRQLVRAT
ncbi:MAG TPA: host attachment protein [Phycisphaerae bacterium]|nr:host attachment protein [Phycisphaerae bacterium]